VVRSLEDLERETEGNPGYLLAFTALAVRSLEDLEHET
jgi:hypothetical protein